MITAFQPDAFQNDAFQIAAAVPVVPVVTRQQPTHDKYYVSRQSKYNVYIPDDISLEEALLLWWQIINE
jgi:hypothetical protein